jgi:purine-binding chemotaxis protein CheW
MNEESKVMNEPADNTLTADEPMQYLTFRLDGEAFATGITRIREVLEYTRVTKVPRTPDYMLGVINLRGNVVPVVDLRQQFEMATSEPTVDTCIIIIEVNVDGAATVLGALADSVQEVIELKAEQMEPAPMLGTRVDNRFIRAMAKLDDRFVIVLDMDRVFSLEQLEGLAEGGDDAAMAPQAMQVGMSASGANA